MKDKRELLIVLLALALAILACAPMGQSEDDELPTQAPTVESIEEQVTVEGLVPTEESVELPTQEKPQGQFDTFDFDLTGNWYSEEWGPLTFTQTGSTVIGTYVYHDGQIEGQLEGNRLNYRWWELVPGQPFETQTDPTYYGYGYFDVSKDGNFIEGEWRFGNTTEGTWDGPWTAEREE
jgi:hypothetical protein